MKMMHRRSIFSFKTLNSEKILQIQAVGKPLFFCEGVEMVHFPHPNFGSCDRVGWLGASSHYPACAKHRCLLGLGRAEEIAAILQEFRLNESPSRGIAANLHHFRPFCFKPKRNGENSCNFAGFPFWNRRPYRIAVFMQDFAYRIGVPGKIVEFADFACRIGVPGKIEEFCGFRLPDGRV